MPNSLATVGRMVETGIIAICTMKLPRATVSRLLRCTLAGNSSAAGGAAVATTADTGRSLLLRGCSWLTCRKGIVAAPRAATVRRGDARGESTNYMPRPAAGPAAGGANPRTGLLTVQRRPDLGPGGSRPGRSEQRPYKRTGDDAVLAAPCGWLSAVFGGWAVLERRRGVRGQRHLEAVDQVADRRVVADERD